MKMVLIGNGKFAPDISEILRYLNPFSMGAAEIGKEVAKATAEAVTLSLLDKAVMWVVHIGLPVLSEALLVWSMFCLLMAITGKGAWMERAVKSFIGFVMVGVAAHAV